MGIVLPQNNTRNFIYLFIMLFTNITGKKETKGFNESLVIATPTLGDFRLTPLAQRQLGVQDGDSILILTHPEDSSRVFVAKGVAGVPMRDENDVIVKDGRGRVVYEEDSQFGAVLRPASEGSVNLKFTGAAGWNAVNGSTEHNTFFTLGEPVEAGVPTGKEDAKGDAEIHETVFYELIFKERKAKAQRKAGEGVDASEEEEEDYGMEATAEEV